MIARAAALLAALGLAASASAQADLHEIRWYVHVDMISGSEPLGFWQAFIDQATAQSETLLKGNQGSDSFADEACCTELRVASVGLFGSPGDANDTPDLATSADFSALRATIQGGDPGGSVAFLVRDIMMCGGSGNAIGCTDPVACDTNANDDPDLEFAVSVVAMLDANADFVPEGVGGLAHTLAHERGHTACLGHVSANPCELMQASGSGGCLSAAACTDYREARTTTAPGDPCACHAGGGAVQPDGGFCGEGATYGFCSGGVCAPTSGIGGRVGLLAAGAPEAVETAAPLDEVTDDLLRTSDLPGGWTDVANFPDDVQGLEYDPDRGVLWGVLDNGADDQIVAIDPATGAITSTLVTLTGHPNVIALAFHPGPTSAGTDDHLLANSAEDGASCDLITMPAEFCAGDLIEIDPATGVVSFVGDMNLQPVGGLRGMAYDSRNGELYGTAWALGGLWRFTNLSCNGTSCSCPSAFCTLAEVDAVDQPRVVSSLAYSPESHRLYLVGTQGGAQLFHQSIDPDTFEVTPVIGVEGHTPGGLAAAPLAEPGGAGALVAGLALTVLARARRHRHA